ncbi:uncharacterized protein LOC134842239 isoform X3 [Symsagittifera roscoffensis]|uniref:uncharacterized protein LOC134842239 isoform X3 n=1 Tax=Symsagittifera roscoffensis TaxID=84072 RepID=UPI00307B34AF
MLFMRGQIFLQKFFNAKSDVEIDVSIGDIHESMDKLVFFWPKRIYMYELLLIHQKRREQQDEDEQSDPEDYGSRRYQDAINYYRYERLLISKRDSKRKTKQNSGFLVREKPRVSLKFRCLLGDTTWRARNKERARKRKHQFFSVPYRHMGRKKRRKKVEMANCNIEQNSCEQHNDIRVSNEREDITTTETAGADLRDVASAQMDPSCNHLSSTQEFEINPRQRDKGAEIQNFTSAQINLSEYHPSVTQKFQSNYLQRDEGVDQQEVLLPHSISSNLHDEVGIQQQITYHTVSPSKCNSAEPQRHRRKNVLKSNILIADQKKPKEAEEKHPYLKKLKFHPFCVLKQPGRPEVSLGFDIDRLRQQGNEKRDDNEMLPPTTNIEVPSVVFLD